MADRSWGLWGESWVGGKEEVGVGIKGQSERPSWWWIWFLLQIHELLTLHRITATHSNVYNQNWRTLKKDLWIVAILVFWLWYYTTALQNFTVWRNRVKCTQYTSYYFLQRHVNLQLSQKKIPIKKALPIIQPMGETHKRKCFPVSVQMLALISPSFGLVVLSKWSFGGGVSFYFQMS